MLFSPTRSVGWSLLSVIAVKFLLASCGPLMGAKENGPGFVINQLGRSGYGLSRRLNDPEISICILGANGNDQAEQVGERIKSAIKAWTAPLGELVELPLISVQSQGRINCSDASATVVLAEQNDPAFTRIGMNPVLNLRGKSSYPVILHETGHAFGLGDTYDPKTRICPENRPMSVMCSAVFGDLQGPDQEGIKAIYHDLYEVKNGSHSFNHAAIGN